MPDIPAARNALRVLTYLAKRGAPVPASALARDLGMPRSSAYQLIRVMIDEGFLVRYPEDRAYGLSGLLSEIGSSSHYAARLARLAQPLLERLVAETRLPVVAHLAVLSGADVLYLAKAQAFRAPTTVSSIGVRLPAHLTATGRSMLARLPAAQVRALYPHGEDLILRHGTRPDSLADLTRLLEETRTRGWAREDGDITLEYSSVAASAVDHNGYPVAAVGLTFRTISIDRTSWHPLGEAAVATAKALTGRLVGRS
ncbi:MAG TPA: IclR family transcriptional regulator [Lacisediminihabitans sp.]|uniref:IclR family transcriptional regulator n=1 Tax=Lacisediminihabitans sp. TaxID=2787631 RepID=UPI002ED8AF94